MPYWGKQRPTPTRIDTTTQTRAGKHATTQARTYPNPQNAQEHAVLLLGSGAQAALGLLLQVIYGAKTTYPKGTGLRYAHEFMYWTHKDKSCLGSEITGANRVTMRSRLVPDTFTKSR